MTRKTKISIITIGALLVALAGIIVVNFVIHPVYSSYENEDGEFRVEIEGAVYKYLPDKVLWKIDSKPAKRSGYLDNIKTSLHEYEGDSSKNALNVSMFFSDNVYRPLIKEDIELGSVCAANVGRIKVEKPGVNKHLKMILGSTFETTDEKVIPSFFNALKDSSTQLSEDEIVPEEFSKLFVLKCYNKNLPIAAVSYQVYMVNGELACYDESADKVAIIPLQVISEIAGEEFDVEEPLEEE